MTAISSGARRADVFLAGGLFVLRRLGTALVALLGVTTIVFLLTHAVGDPVYLLAGAQSTAAQRAALSHSLGLDQPVWQQYLNYLAGLLHGDLGTSIYSNRPVTDELGSVFPATLELALAALILGVAVTIPLGVIAARKPGGWADRFASGSVRFGVAMPPFWLGILLIYVFVYAWGIFPSPTGELDIGVSTPHRITGMTLVDALLQGQTDVAADAFGHLILPAVTLAVGAFPALLALTRDVVAQVLGSDHHRAARAMGLPPRLALLRYVLPIAAGPIVTQIAMTFGYLLGGTVLVETVFAWPGIGQYSVLSMQRLDYAPVVGVALVTSALYLLLYFIADVIALAIDPRIRRGR